MKESANLVDTDIGNNTESSILEDLLRSDLWRCDDDDDDDGNINGDDCGYFIFIT